MSRTKADPVAISLSDALTRAGLSPGLVSLLDRMPRTEVRAEPRRTFREPGRSGGEVMFVRSGILSKVKVDTSGRRQIVALRFAGEGILPRDGPADYGIEAVVASEVLIASAYDFNPIVDANPEMQRFFRRLVERNEAIGFAWMVNSGRRDTTARIAHLLCETAVRMGLREGESMLNPFTQQQIAEITGQTSVNVNRVLADMERQGLIQRNGRQIEFQDWNAISRVGGFKSSYLD